MAIFILFQELLGVYLLHLVSMYTACRKFAYARKKTGILYEKEKVKQIATFERIASF